MIFKHKKESLFLFLGDCLIFYFSLYLALTLRYFALPSNELISNHIIPFSILSAVWLLTFFITGLYEKHTLLLKTRLPSAILNAQIGNTFLAVLFFYFIPYFKIAPKTILFVYLVISFGLILAWRLYGVRALSPTTKQKGIIIGQGDELRELIEEVNHNSRYGLEFVSSIDIDEIEAVDFQNEIVSRVYAEEIQIIAIDLNNPKVEPILPHLYNLIFSKVKFIDMYKIYEDIFDRVPLSLVKYNWFLENISTDAHTAYDTMKRIMDIVISLPLAVLSLIFYPFVYLAIKIEDGGPLFITQERVGKNGTLVRMHKFRSMSRNELDPTKSNDNKVTKVGSIIRKLRIDEYPQFWDVVRGSFSLIGPRSELPSAVKRYEEEVPYYSVRHLIKPGLSGWAQLYGEHAHHVADLSKTKNKLSYDLYYIKNRSLMLDLKIALKTLKVLLSRSGV
ncbi:MAG: exopolysaccharide biosynthesis polyprenyl glycosylphosphotransferase [Patescibacteria group bacterium]